jgi:signal transduction histidine kinase
MNRTGQSSQTYRDLMFFGKVNASISHELKNILAIISETAGLMTDLLELAAKGRPMESETLMSCGRDIVEEIQRGFSTIKQMNVFSHSVDETVKEIDLDKILEVVIGMTGFLSYTGKVILEKGGDDHCRVMTSPFRLQQAVYETLVAIFRSIGPKGEIRIKTATADNDQVHIIFSGIDPKIEAAPSLENAGLIAKSINGRFSGDDDGQTFILAIPRTIEASELSS